MEDRFTFRIWNRHKKEYERPILDSISFLFGKFFSCCDIYNKKKYAIEQCTGLKDMEENLVYEGDIVYSYDNDEAGIIEFDVARFVISFPKSKTWDDLYGSFKVIGNIHENPELLGGK